MSRRAGGRFRRTGWLAKGYHRRQVDAFLATLDLALQGGAPPMSATDIRRAGFELVHRGYDVGEVDRLLDQRELQAVELALATSRRGRLDPAAEAAFLRAELAAPYMRRFPRQHYLRRGYDIDQVDEFLDRVVRALESADSAGGAGSTGGTGSTTISTGGLGGLGGLGSTGGQGGQGSTGSTNGLGGAARTGGSASTGVPGLMLADVRTVAFRPKRGGYSEQAVDETLDRVVEMMLLMQAAARAPRPVARRA